MKLVMWGFFYFARLITMYMIKTKRSAEAIPITKKCQPRLFFSLTCSVVFIAEDTCVESLFTIESRKVSSLLLVTFPAVSLTLRPVVSNSIVLKLMVRSSDIREFVIQLITDP